MDEEGNWDVYGEPPEECAPRAAFAACAGFLAYCLLEGLGGGKQ